MTDALPLSVDAALVQLADSAWRLRKQAVETLEAYIEDGPADADTLRVLIERLLDRLTNPNTIDGRAAAHEVLVAIGPACADALAARLDQGGAAARMLVDLLGEVGGRSDVPTLVAMLEGPEREENLAAAACTALGALGGPQAEVALRHQLEGGTEMLRVYALDALRAARAVVPVAEVEPLVQSPLTRVGAATVLGLSADVAALPLLIGLLDNPMAGVRAAAAAATVRLQAALGERASIVSGAVARLSPATRAHIRALILHPDHEVRIAAIRLAGMASDSDAIEIVLSAMDDPRIHEEAFEMVHAVGPAAAAALGRAAESLDAVRREPLMRLVAALAPGSADQRLINTIVGALDEPDDEAALAAAETLQNMGNRSSLGGLYRAMAEPGRLGEAAADAMGAVMVREEVGHADLELIVGTAWPQSGALAQNLCRMVGRLEDPRYTSHLVAVLGSPDVGVRVAAATALGGLKGENEGASVLSFTLADEEPQVRAAACRSLGRLRAMSAWQSLVAATNDDSAMVRAAAVAALVCLDNPITLARLRAVIAEDPMPSVVVQAIAGLGRSALDQDLTMLMSLCTSADFEVVKAAARALGGFSVHRATAALLGLLGHTRWDVRWTAAEVLAERNDPTALAPLAALAASEEDPHVRRSIDLAIEALRSLGAG